MSILKQCQFTTRLILLLAFFSFSFIHTSLAVAYAQMEPQPVITRTLQNGTQGSDVSGLQYFLKGLGFYTYPLVTGFFGPITSDAVAAFQEHNGITSIGIVGPQTRAKISQMLGAAVITATGSSSPSTQLSSLVNIDSGDLLAYVDTFVARIPRKYSSTLVNGYDVPTVAEISGMAAVMNAIQAGDLESAASLAVPYSYKITQYTDTATGRPLVILSEIQNADGTWPHAWGMYIIASDTATSDTLIEVPHTLADLNTERSGVLMFRQTRAKALLLAGSHRYANQDSSSDMAHVQSSVFETMHEQLLASTSVVIQPHGYSKTNYSTAAPSDSVLSSGTSESSTLIEAVNTSVKATNFTSCIYTGDLDNSSIESANPCYELGATTNVQGISARALGARFVSAETETAVRTDVGRNAAYVSALINGITFASTSDTITPSIPTNIAGSAISTTQINLSWSSSSDNIGVTSYKIYRNGVQVGTSMGPTYGDTGLVSATPYSYAVAAQDVAGNTSATSSTVTVTTFANIPTIGIGSRVKTITSNVNVRSKPNTSAKVLCTKPIGAVGTVVDGPRSAQGYIWWNVNFDITCDGWVAGTYLSIQ